MKQTEEPGISSYDAPNTSPFGVRHTSSIDNVGYHQSTNLAGFLSHIDVHTKPCVEIVPVDTGLALLWLIRDGVTQRLGTRLSTQAHHERQIMYNTVVMQLRKYGLSNPLPTVSVLKTPNIVVNIHVEHSLFEGRITSGAYNGAFVQLMTPKDFDRFARETDHVSTILIAEFISDLLLTLRGV